MSGPYNETVRDHFENPRHQWRMDQPTVVADAHNPVCGDRVRLFLRLEGDTIKEASFQAQGCPASVAASSMTTCILEGKSLTEARALTNEDVERALGGLPPGKGHCSVLAEDAIHQALRVLPGEAGPRAPKA